MNDILKAQLNKLTAFNFTVDGQHTAVIPDDFKEIIFFKNTEKPQDSICVVFEDYIVTPFDGFDFHDKFNHGNPPYNKVMYGNIEKETEKMYYLSVHSSTSDVIWSGWCPKKSCKIKQK